MRCTVVTKTLQDYWWTSSLVSCWSHPSWALASKLRAPYSPTAWSNVLLQISLAQAHFGCARFIPTIGSASGTPMTAGVSAFHQRQCSYLKLLRFRAWRASQDTSLYLATQGICTLSMRTKWYSTQNLNCKVMDSPLPHTWQIKTVLSFAMHAAPYSCAKTAKARLTINFASTSLSKTLLWNPPVMSIQSRKNIKGQTLHHLGVPQQTAQSQVVRKKCCSFAAISALSILNS